MKLKIRGEQIEVTDALKNYVQKKISRLDKYFDAPLTSEVNVKLSVKRGKHRVEVTIPLPGVMLRAEVKSEDMYASIDLVMDKLERQIRKHKTKVNRKYRQQGGLKDLILESVGEEQTQSQEEEYELVRVKRFTLRPMDAEEAILQMNMLGHNFFVFANAETDEVNVVYRREDGTYGLIEPVK